MRGYVVRKELTLAGRGIKLNGMQGGIGYGNLDLWSIKNGRFQLKVTLSEYIPKVNQKLTSKNLKPLIFHC